MERLSPNERAVYVLREAFAYPHREIAEILDITEAASQQIFHRAKEHLARRQARTEIDAAAARRIVEEFLAAATSGRTEPLVRAAHRRTPSASATAAARSRPAPRRSRAPRGREVPARPVQAQRGQARPHRRHARGLRLDRQRRARPSWSPSTAGSSASCAWRSPPRASPRSATRSTPTSSTARPRSGRPRTTGSRCSPRW